MANEPKTLQVTPDQMHTLQLVRAMVSQAAIEFKTLPVELQDRIFDFHNENGSLNHCLRWGEQACDELVVACQAKPKKRLSPK